MNKTVLTRHPHTETIPSGERVVIYQSQRQNSIVLNPTGSWLWNQLATPRTLSFLVESLNKEHPEVALETLKDDLQAYVGEMVQNELLVWQD